MLEVKKEISLHLFSMSDIIHSSRTMLNEECVNVNKPLDLLSVCILPAPTAVVGEAATPAVSTGVTPAGVEAVEGCCAAAFGLKMWNNQFLSLMVETVHGH